MGRNFIVHLRTQVSYVLGRAHDESVVRDLRLACLKGPFCVLLPWASPVARGAVRDLAQETEWVVVAERDVQERVQDAQEGVAENVDHDFLHDSSKQVADVQ